MQRWVIGACVDGGEGCLMGAPVHLSESESGYGGTKGKGDSSSP